MHPLAWRFYGDSGFVFGILLSRGKNIDAEHNGFLSTDRNGVLVTKHFSLQSRETAADTD
jgi:hypothetical protein